jgi:hypothetical protein
VGATVLTLVLAVFIGGSLGVLGSGGSIITLPVLVYLAGVPANQAVSMSMAIVGATALFGALIQLKRGNVSIRAAIIFSGSGMVGAYFGSSGTHLLSKQALMLSFAGVMLIVGSLMLRPRKQTEARRECSVPLGLAVGFSVGLLTGFLGVGGGFLIVPALVLAAGLDTRLACGTSLAVIALNSATGLAGQLRYVTVDWSLLGRFLIFAFAGMIAGIALARHIQENQLRRIFGGALIVVAVAIATLNRHA